MARFCQKPYLLNIHIDQFAEMFASLREKQYRGEHLNLSFRSNAKFVMKQTAIKVLTSLEFEKHLVCLKGDSRSVLGLIG